MKVYSKKSFYYSQVFNVYCFLQGILLYSFSLTANDYLFKNSTLQYVYGFLFLINILALSITFITFSYKIKKDKLLLIKQNLKGFKKINYLNIVIFAIFSFPFNSYILKNYSNILDINTYNASQIIGCVCGLIIIISSIINLLINFKSLKTKLYFYRKI